MERSSQTRRHYTFLSFAKLLAATCCVQHSDWLAQRLLIVPTVLFSGEAECASKEAGKIDLREKRQPQSSFANEKESHATCRPRPNHVPRAAESRVIKLRTKRESAIKH